ncbi:PPC domain-containing DNA-binding protein [Spiroplasma endosymbiont of Notiophilus biguttatus]|uniref:PPC domain-containing DNA-binding protein n=1 Tax=Spiroplasma endosymbiont of Notiophilus biguttatus TaxID=3066285 RepID=UPI00313AAFD4
MKIKKMIGNKYALIIEKDEMIIKTLEQFAIKEKIGMALFQMIGAVTNVTLGYVPKKSNDYVKKTFLEQYELLSTIGTIIWDEKDTNKPIIHCHTTFGDDNFNVIGGHMLDAKVAIKVEVIIDILSNEKISQVIDNKSNFHIWKLS